MDLGPTELLIVLAIALLLFGGAKLPKLARSMGEASREFKKGVDGHHKDADARLEAESLKSSDEPKPLT
jgi:sec-independent protein translocase protein TatA